MFRYKQISQLSNLVDTFYKYLFWKPCIKCMRCLQKKVSNRSSGRPRKLQPRRGYSNYFLMGYVAYGLKPLPIYLKNAWFYFFCFFFSFHEITGTHFKGLVWPKWDPLSKDFFNEKVTHVHGTSPNTLSCEYPPLDYDSALLTMPLQICWETWWDHEKYKKQPCSYKNKTKSFMFWSFLTMIHIHISKQNVRQMSVISFSLIILQINNIVWNKILKAVTLE